LVLGGCEELGHEFIWDEKKKTYVCRRCRKTIFETGLAGEP